MDFLKWVLIVALVLLVGVPAILSHLKNGGPVARLATLAVILIALALLVPQFRSLVLKATISLLLLGLAVLYIYQSVMTIRDATHNWAETVIATAVNAWSRGWENVGDIAKEHIPGLGPDTVAEIGAGAAEAHTEYQKCLSDATSQLTQVQPKASTCAKMSGRDLEVCLEKILFEYGDDQGALSVVQCSQKKLVTGGAAKYIKPIANLFCVGEPFLPEFLKKWLCVSDGSSNQPQAQPSAADSYDSLCLRKIFNDNLEQVPDRNCQRFQTDPQRWQQCVIDSITAGLPQTGLQQVQSCRTTP